MDGDDFDFLYADDPDFELDDSLEHVDDEHDDCAADLSDDEDTDSLSNTTPSSSLTRALLAAAPFLAQPPPLPPILQPTTIAELMAYLSLATGEETNRILLLLQPSGQGPPRPEQGGQHRTGCAP
ncbi:hypothetical protein B0H13DRAFT_2676554 [Mycena leptocephala]|nr:hypothetical protein B0H13DRAFT_2676554 [Mycena leptocephala]